MSLPPFNMKGSDFMKSIDIYGYPLSRNQYGDVIWINRDGSTTIISIDIAVKLCEFNITRLSN